MQRRAFGFILLRFSLVLRGCGLVPVELGTEAVLGQGEQGGSRCEAEKWERERQVTGEAAENGSSSS